MAKDYNRYIGETKRTLKVRLVEHKGEVILTMTLLFIPMKPIMRLTRMVPELKVTAPNYWQRRIMEAIHVHCQLMRVTVTVILNL